MTQFQPPQPPPGQPPIDPRGAFQPVPPPPQGARPGWPPPPPGMPPGMMPPPMMPWPPPQPKTSRGIGAAILTAVATVIFLGSVIFNLILIIAVAARSGDVSTARLTTLIEGDASQKVAVVPVHGILLSHSFEHFDKLLKQVEKDSTVKVLVIEINTPGGTVGASDEIYHRIKQYKAKTGHPVVVAMTEMATSGGYYISCAADDIYAEPTTWTGNIGVLMERLDLSELANKYGVHDDTMHSSGADFKDAGSMLRPMRPDEHAYLLDLLDQASKQFKTAITTGRTTRLTKNIDTIANGKVYSSQEALTLGLIDGIQYGDGVYKAAATRAGLSSYSVVKFDEAPSIFDLLATDSKFRGNPASSQSAFTINGINVNVDSESLQELLSPRPMYLWRGK